MFKTRNTENLLFEFDRPSRVAITSLFVFFPFVAVWLDNKKRVLEIKKISPFLLSIKPKKNAKYLVEIPLNVQNTTVVKHFLKTINE